MNSMNEFPKIMENARIDLGGNFSGEFSPEDWQKILAQAEARWNALKLESTSEQEAWQSVVREFHTQGRWGFRPNYVAPKAKAKEMSLGVRLVIMTFISFTITEIAVVWLGQIYTFSDEPRDKWLFLLAVALVMANVVYFLWRTRKHQD